MINSAPKLGYTYFTSKEYFLDRYLQAWLPQLKRWGATQLVLNADFHLAIPEDIFLQASKLELEPIIHFNTVLPSARSFKDCALLLDTYKKRGASYIILGDRPNQKHNWPSSDWQDDCLVDHFLERFIPLACYAEKIGLQPVMAPLEPGGDYWDCSFLEMILSRLKERQLTHLLDTLVLASYGWTHNKPLTWGQGGPERWPDSKPYLTPEGQEDQIGFHNFEWLQAISQAILGMSLPVLILDAGRPDKELHPVWDRKVGQHYKHIRAACTKAETRNTSSGLFNNQHVLGCTFSLDTLEELMGNDFSMDALNHLFLDVKQADKTDQNERENGKSIAHYLLLPAYASGVSDVILNKVRPIIKKYHPTVGFSLQEAACAVKVSIFPDDNIFTEEDIKQLRAAGCEVEMLPESGIEIATLLQA